MGVLTQSSCLIKSGPPPGNGLLGSSEGKDADPGVRRGCSVGLAEGMIVLKPKASDRSFESVTLSTIRPRARGATRAGARAGAGAGRARGLVVWDEERCI